MLPSQWQSPRQPPGVHPQIMAWRATGPQRCNQWIRFPTIWNQCSVLMMTMPFGPVLPTQEEEPGSGESEDTSNAVSNQREGETAGVPAEQTSPADQIDDVDEGEEVMYKPPSRARRRRRRRQGHSLVARCFVQMFPAWVMSVLTPFTAEEHVDQATLDAIQQTADVEPGKVVVPPEEVRKAVGADLDAWVLAAQAEHDRFVELEAISVATEEEIKQYGRRPLPMFNVWSRTDEDFRKCRSCIAGIFNTLTPPHRGGRPKLNRRRSSWPQSLRQ